MSDTYIVTLLILAFSLGVVTGSVLSLVGIVWYSVRKKRQFDKRVNKAVLEAFTEDEGISA